MIKRFGGALAVAALAALAPASASAAVTTSYDGATGVLSVDLSASGDEARLKVADGGNVAVNGTPVSGATTTSVDTIDIVDSSGGDTTAWIDLAGGFFAPGASPEPGDDEIEWTLDPGGGSDTLAVSSLETARFMAIGDGGVNLNADEPDPADADLTMPVNPVDRLLFITGDGTLTGAGGFGSGSSPTTIPMDVSGGRQVTGGAGDDLFFMGSEATLACGDGYDLVQAMPGALVAGDCETVTWLHGDPAGWPEDPNGSSPPDGTKAAIASLSGRSFRVRRGRVTLRVACAAPTGSSCEGRVSLRRRVRRRVRSIGSASYATQAGRTAKVVVKLNRLGRRLLRRRSQVRATARISVEGGQAVRKAVTLRR